MTPSCPRALATVLWAMAILTVTSCTSRADDNPEPRPALPDFQNFTFPRGTCDSATPLTTKNGEADDADGEPAILSVTDFRGDLDGRTGDEAVVVVQCMRSGVGADGTANEAAVWVLGKDGVERGPAVATATRSTDRETRLAEATIDEQRLAVVEYALGPDDANCCPSARVDVTYKLVDGELAIDGTPVVSAATVDGRPAPAAAPFVIGALHGFDVSSLVSPELRPTVGAAMKPLEGGELESMNCELVGDITSECQIAVRIDGSRKRLRVSTQPVLPDDVEYVDGQFLRGSTPYTPERDHVVDANVEP